MVGASRTIVGPKKITLEVAMTIDEYGWWAAGDRSPGQSRDERLIYCALGLLGEAGEIADRMRKMMREGALIVVTRTAGIGASHPLLSAPTKVRLLNRLPPLTLGGGYYSSCPFLVIRLCDAWLPLNHSPSDDMQDVPVLVLA
jgi:hypothetical protein